MIMQELCIAFGQQSGANANYAAEVASHHAQRTIEPQLESTTSSKTYLLILTILPVAYTAYIHGWLPDVSLHPPL